MPITLGAYTFAEGAVAAVEEHRETGGRDARAIVLRGVLHGYPTLEALEAELDAILAAASGGEQGVPLSLRAGRTLAAVRTGYTREIERSQRIARFTLALEAPDPFEYAAVPVVLEWTLSGYTPSRVCTGGGNCSALPQIVLAAAGPIETPALFDGVRLLRYGGTLEAGQTLTLDGAARQVLLDGDEVTAYTEGLFPEIPPGGTALTLAHAGADPPAGTATVTYRHRWW